MAKKKTKETKTMESAEALLEMAEAEPTGEDAMWFARRASQLDPDNMEAELMVARLSTQDDVVLLRKVGRLIDKAEQWMEEEGFMETDSFGNYWAIPEARPYVRLRVEGCELLMKLGIYGKAMVEAEELLWLCGKDELGIRYKLMVIYAILGEENKAKELCEKYGESLFMLLALSVLYFRKGDLRTARTCVAKILEREMGPEELQPDQVPELNVLFTSAPGYYRWGYHVMKTLRRRAMRKKNSGDQEEDPEAGVWGIA